MGHACLSTEFDEIIEFSSRHWVNPVNIQGWVNRITYLFIVFLWQCFEKGFLEMEPAVFVNVTAEQVETH